MNLPLVIEGMTTRGTGDAGNQQADAKEQRKGRDDGRITRAAANWQNRPIRIFRRIWRPITNSKPLNEIQDGSNCVQGLLGDECRIAVRICGLVKRCFDFSRNGMNDERSYDAPNLICKWAAWCQPRSWISCRIKLMMIDLLKFYDVPWLWINAERNTQSGPKCYAGSSKLYISNQKCRVTVSPICPTDWTLFDNLYIASSLFRLGLIVDLARLGL